PGGAPWRPPLELPELVDFSLDSTMPTFDHASDGSAPDAVPAAHSTELPPLTADDLPSLDALDALTLALPPLPDFSDWSLDTSLVLDLPSPDFSDMPAAGQE